MRWLTIVLNKWRGNSQENKSTPIFLTNSLSGSKELFIPIKPGFVSLYTCGPTVYGRAHIGNLRSFVFSDTLARTLKANGYRVRRVINITDVGHLVDDADSGEDKISLGARREGLSAKNISDRYTTFFLQDISELDIDTNDIFFPRASEYIREQISLARTLEEKGFAYKLKEGLYFDTSRFRGYGKLGNVTGVGDKAKGRIKSLKGKHQSADFALWRIAKPNDLQKWDSPWGLGNPGWHIECSAMSRALLGIKIDIHTGGEDHIAVHHNNEIAQSEAASGQTFVHYWLHNAFLTMNGEKSSKSLGNVVTLSDIAEKGLSPLALRYFFLQAHYRTSLSFSWEALEAAAQALSRLWKLSTDIKTESKEIAKHSSLNNDFILAMHDDLATPQALGILWDSLKSEEYSPEEKWSLIKEADTHLGLSLIDHSTNKKAIVPDKIKKLLEERKIARTEKDFERADHIRNDIEKCGYTVDDNPTNSTVTKKFS